MRLVSRRPWTIPYRSFVSQTMFMPTSDGTQHVPSLGRLRNGPTRWSLASGRWPKLSSWATRTSFNGCGPLFAKRPAAVRREMVWSIGSVTCYPLILSVGPVGLVHWTSGPKTNGQRTKKKSLDARLIKNNMIPLFFLVFIFVRLFFSFWLTIRHWEVGIPHPKEKQRRSSQGRLLVCFLFLSERFISCFDCRS